MSQPARSAKQPGGKTTGVIGGPQVVVAEVSDQANLASVFAEALQQVVFKLPEGPKPKVVIKPNLCDNAAWDTGVTSDPAWLPLLAKELRARRPDVIIQVVESDAISAYRAFRSCDETFERLGYVEAAREAGVQLVNLSREESWEVQVPTFPEPVPIPALFFQDFFFISLANVKLHPYDRFTGIMKNNYGLLPQPDRSAMHVRLPEILFTVNRLCPTDLAILDGRIALEGRGPIIGRPKRFNRLIIGNDALAVDQTACRLIGLDPERVRHLRHAARLSRPLAVPRVYGNLTPQPLEADDPKITDQIAWKFAARRWSWNMERLSLRIIRWLSQARRNPGSFVKRIFRRILPH